jgi:hypothetical protein
MRSKTGVQRDEEKRSFLGAKGRSGSLLILGPKYPLIRAGVQVLLRKMSRLEEVRGRKEFRSQMEESEQQLENLVRELKACPPPPPQSLIQLCLVGFAALSVTTKNRGVHPVTL